MKFSLATILLSVNHPIFGDVNQSKIGPVIFYYRSTGPVLGPIGEDAASYRPLTIWRYDRLLTGIARSKKIDQYYSFLSKTTIRKVRMVGGPQFWGDPICTIPFIKDKHIYLVKNSDMANRHIRKMNNAGEKFIIVFKGIPNLGLPFRGGCSTLSIRYMHSGENSVQWI